MPRGSGAAATRAGVRGVVLAARRRPALGHRAGRAVIFYAQARQHRRRRAAHTDRSRAELDRRARATRADGVTVLLVREQAERIPQPCNRIQGI